MTPHRRHAIEAWWWSALAAATAMALTPVGVAGLAVLAVVAGVAMILRVMT